MSENVKWKEEIRRGVEGLRLPPEREADIVEELAGHLQDEYDSLIAKGASEAEAWRITIDGLRSHRLLAELGNVEKSARREPISANAPDKARIVADLWRDFRFALRMLKTHPGFATLAVLSLALGIGANAAMFSIVRAVLIRPLPYREANRLVRAANDGYYPPGGLVALRQESRMMDLAGFDLVPELNLTGLGDAWRLTGSSVSADLFRILGAEAELGRIFRPGEDQPGRDNLVILSHALWRNKFNGDPEIIGRVIRLGDADRQVTGVMPAGFAFPDAGTQFWIPLHLDPRDPAAYWARGFMPVIGRLRATATLEQAQQEIRSLTRSMVALFPYPMSRDWNSEATVLPLQQYLVRNVRTKLMVLQLATGLVLLITCANVANLLLVRGASRHKEIAVRAALGAARTRIARQLLTENLTLALAGGFLGIALASSAFSVLKAALPAGSLGADVQFSWQVVAFTGVLSLVTGLIFGVLPAFSASRNNIAGTIKAGGQRSAGTGSTRLRGTLIVGEVALAVVLTVCAGLLIKSLWRLSQANPGFEAEHILTLAVSPNQSLCQKRAACIALFDELLRRAEQIPSVHDAAAANTLPLAANIPTIPVDVEGHPYIPGQSMWPMFWAGAVTPDYFRVMRIPILAGRGPLESDAENSAPVIVVSAAMARRYWPDQNPIGRHVRVVFESHWRTVVGVAGDVRQYDLANHSPGYIQGDMYMPYAQSVTNERQLPASMTLILRTGAEPEGLANHLRELVRDLNPNVPVGEIRTMESLVDDSTQQSRSMTWLFVTFAAASLLLAAIGAYSVVSCSTSQRTFEIGMRVALGASARNIFRLVLGQSLRLVIAGLAVGLGISMAVTRVLAAFLYDTSAMDPLILVTVGGVLVAVALLAGYIPARRAASVDPLTALRME